jgi:fructokinase
VIVAFGEAIVDLFSEPLGCTVGEARHFTPHLGGALANVAVTVARLGGPVRFVGAVGRDGHGERLLRELTAAGVDVSCVAQVPERTAVTFVQVGRGGKRSFLFHRAHTADQALTLECLDIDRVFDGARWLVMGTSAHISEPLAGVARRLVCEAEGRGLLRAVDLNVRAHRWHDRDAMHAAVRHVTAGAVLVKASEEDLAALDLPVSLDALAGLAPRAAVVLTLAERGAVARVAGHELTVAAPAVSCVDATGAGDAFVACLLTALYDRGVPSRDVDVAHWSRALEAACALGARAVTAVGATTALRAPWPDLVYHVLRRVAS